MTYSQSSEPRQDAKTPEYPCQTQPQLHEAWLREEPSWSALSPWLRAFWFSDLIGAWWCLLLQVECCVYLPHLLTRKGHPVLYKANHLSSACRLPILTSICLGHSLSSLVTFWSSQRAVFQKDNPMVAQENWRRMDGLKKALGQRKWVVPSQGVGREGRKGLTFPQSTIRRDYGLKKHYHQLITMAYTVCLVCPPLTSKTNRA